MVFSLPKDLCSGFVIKPSLKHYRKKLLWKIPKNCNYNMFTAWHKKVVFVFINNFPVYRWLYWVLCSVLLKVSSALTFWCSKHGSLHHQFRWSRLPSLNSLWKAALRCLIQMISIMSLTAVCLVCRAYIHLFICCSPPQTQLFWEVPAWENCRELLKCYSS